MRLLHSLLAVALLLPVLAGCMASERPPVVSGAEVVRLSSLQVMIKYRDGRDEQAARADLARLNGIAGLPLDYVRPMSGQAHVMRFPGGASARQIEQAMERLRADPALQYIEADRKVTHP